MSKNKIKMIAIKVFRFKSKTKGNPKKEEFKYL